MIKTIILAMEGSIGMVIALMALVLLGGVFTDSEALVKTVTIFGIAFLSILWSLKGIDSFKDSIKKEKR